jgi:hypothetical protein
VALELEEGRAPGSMPFQATQVLAPLPRAHHWVDGSAYDNHVELVRQARGAEMPATFWTDPLVYQGGSDDFLAPTADVPLPSEEQPSLGERSARSRVGCVIRQRLYSSRSPRSVRRLKSLAAMRIRRFFRCLA